MSSRNGAQPLEAELFERFCRDALVLEQGRPFVIEGWQSKMLADFFEGTRETLILIPKKNGKTTLLAALGLFHLLTTPDADCVIVAASRDQAGTMLRQAQGFIRRSETLQERFEVNKREITYKRLGGRIRIVASDVDTVQGWIGTLALVDEVGHHKDEDLYGVFRDGLGPRQGQIVAISTAGDDESSALGVMRARLHAREGFHRDGAYRYVRTDVQSFHEWALDAEEDLDDLEAVKTANPASWQTVPELRIRHDSDSMRPWQWARFACGAWVSGEDAAISEKEWRACANGEDIEPGTKAVHIGVDLAFKWDTTAFVPVVKVEGGIQVGKPIILTPPQDGTTIPYEHIFDAAQQMADKYPQATFVFDPSRGGEQLAEQIDNLLPDSRFAAHSQDPRFMCLAAERLTTGIADRTLRHCDNRELNAHVLSAAAYFVGERWKFVKQRKKNLPIDGVIALAMAYSTLVGEKTREVLIL